MSAQGCVHHWLIDDQNHGVCLHCSESRAFKGGEGNIMDAMRHVRAPMYSKAADDDGIRNSDLSHFRLSNYEAF